MKRIISIFLTLCLLLCLSVSVFAADTSRSYTFDLTANGAHEVSVKTGDVITVTLELKRTDSGSGPMYGMQDEIDYDDDYLSLQASSELLYTGCASADIGLLSGGRSHYLNFVSTAGGANWASSVTVGTFKLKVTYSGKATTKLINSNYLVSTADGKSVYSSSANDVTIHINGGSDSGTGSDKKTDLVTAEHIAYVSGYADGTVRPNANITRAETAQMLYRLLTPETRNKNSRGSINYSDVSSSDWYYTSVRTLSNLDIIKGYSDGSFRPNANITRAEFAAMLCRFSDASGSAKTSFTDISGHWARTSIEAVSAKGWVTGYADGTFRPNAKITRAEVMTMLNRMLGRLPASKADLLSGMTTFKDNSDPSVWYYLHVQEATNGHTYTTKSDGIHEKWEALK